MRWKAAAKSFLPPVFTEAYQRARAARGFKGRFRSWTEAASRAGTYSADVILRSVQAAARKQADRPAGIDLRAAGPLSANRDPSYLSAMFLRHAAEHQGKLRVLDFGGGLGATYRFCRPQLGKLPELRWDILEQPNHAAAGREEFENGELRFFESMASYQATCPQGPNVLLLSSVLHYLEDPWKVLDELFALKPAAVIIDRTPFSVEGGEFLTVQVVPPEIYEASFPCRVFSKRELVRRFEAAGYGLETEFRAADALDPSAEFCGFHFIRDPA